MTIIFDNNICTCIIEHHTCTRILRHITLLIRDASLLYGRLLNSDGDGGSVPKAKAPMVSMIKFTHNIMTAFNGGSNPNTALMNVTVSATTFTVS